MIINILKIYLFYSLTRFINTKGCSTSRTFMFNIKAKNISFPYCLKNAIKHITNIAKNTRQTIPFFFCFSSYLNLAFHTNHCNRFTSKFNRSKIVYFFSWFKLTFCIYNLTLVIPILSTLQIINYVFYYRYWTIIIY